MSLKVDLLVLCDNACQTITPTNRVERTDDWLKWGYVKLCARIKKQMRRCCYILFLLDEIKNDFFPFLFCIVLI